MYEDLRNAIKLLKEYCKTHRCSNCPLYHAVCHKAAATPLGYSLERFDLNVKELEDDES